MARRRRKTRAQLSTLLLILLLVAAAYAIGMWLDRVPNPLAPQESAPPAEGILEVHYVDVGQGDATLWRLPGGGVVVYDCGPPAGSAEENPLVVYMRDTLGLARGHKVHALIASHGHLDHVGGCDEVFDTYAVERVYETWYEGADAPTSYARFQEAVLAEGAQVHTLGEKSSLAGETPFQRGARVPLPAEAEAAGVRADILWPGSFRHADWDRIAESSIVVRLVHGEVAFCFQGDIETAQERELASLVPQDACEVYLVGHHGSRHASSDDWLSRVDPEVAVASFGENPYGHPTPEALCRVQQAGAELYATARAGTVIVESDGAQARVQQGRAETADYCAAEAVYTGA